MSAHHEETILELASRQHSVAARWQLVGAGVPGRYIDVRVRRRRLERVQRCVYRVPGLGGARAGEAAAVLSCGPHAVASHHTAGGILSLISGPPAEPVVSVARGRPDARAGMTIHRVRLPEDERTVHDGIPVTTPERTLLDLAPTLRPRTLEQAVAAAMRADQVTEASLRALLERHGSRPGCGRIRALLSEEQAPAYVRSQAEETFLGAVRSAGLPLPAVNARLHGYEVDFLWLRYRVAVEIDGMAYHDSRAAQRRDRRRDGTLASAAGVHVLRFTWHDLTTRREAMLTTLVLTLARGGL